MPMLLWPFPGGSSPPPATAGPFQRLFMANLGKLLTILTGTSGVDFARSFNGTSDYIDVGTHIWDPTTSATFSHWLYINAMPGAYAGLSSSGSTNYHEYYLKSTGQLALYFNNNWGSNGSDPLAGGPTLVTGQWYHLLWTVIANGNLNFYLNGTLTGSFSVGAGTVASNNLDAWLGNDIRSSSRWFNGAMSDIALWNTVLTGTQISNLAAGNRSNTIGANANLVGYWPITGQSPEPDKSGNGYNGTLTGTTVIAGPPSLQPF